LALKRLFEIRVPVIGRVQARVPAGFENVPRPAFNFRRTVLKLGHDWNMPPLVDERFSFLTTASSQAPLPSRLAHRTFL